ncbi:phosphatase domain-containing protein [Bdellovibrio sp. HCB209]|uniref:phosphatase domain-containing protein n=1 Tax=Bdellovibrio sp. HCB209 TaxID=3394354 RepID=UPI0039B63E65
MKKLAIVFMSLALSALAEAKTLVISDIDDTIKVSNILSKARASGSFFDDDSRFVGMAEIYQALARQIPDTEFHYVSLAPKVLMNEQHSDFLEENGFPVTQLHMNSGIKQDPEFKQKVIRQLLQEKQPDLIIYFGDNGQFDAVVYDQMMQEFPQIPALAYIREAYSKLNESKHPTMPGQIGFVTSVEVVLDLISRRLLPVSDYRPIQDIVYDRLQKDDGSENFGPMVFPKWQDCRDFVWKWEVKNPPQKLIEIINAIEARCK